MSKNLIDIEMPDGTIISDVPEGTSQAEVLRRYNLSTAQPSQPVPQVDMRTPGQVAIDQVKNVATGIGQSITGLPGTIKAALTGDVQTLGQGMIGMAQPFVTAAKGIAALPRNSAYPAPTQQEWEQAARGAGQIGGSVAMGAALGKGISTADTTLAKARALRNFETGGNPAATTVERGLAPSGEMDQLAVLRKAPELAQRYPELTKVSGPAFDMKLTELQRLNEANLNAVGKSVPKGTTVLQDTITNGLEKVIDHYRELGEPDAARFVANEWEKWASKDPNIPFDEYMARRQQFGEDINRLGAFRTRTGGVDPKLAAARDAYSAIAKASDPVPGLKQANYDYSLTRGAMENAGMDIKTGRRISGVGAPGYDYLGLAKKALLGGGLAGTAAYEIGKYLGY